MYFIFSNILNPGEIQKSCECEPEVRRENRQLEQQINAGKKNVRDFLHVTTK